MAMFNSYVKLPEGSTSGTSLIRTSPQKLGRRCQSSKALITSKPKSARPRREESCDLLGAADFSMLKHPDDQIQWHENHKIY